MIFNQSFYLLFWEQYLKELTQMFKLIKKQIYFEIQDKIESRKNDGERKNE